MDGKKKIQHGTKTKRTRSAGYLEIGEEDYGGAVLIDKDTALTAAHCVEDVSSADELEVTFGKADLNSKKGVTRRIKHYVKHPKYKKKTLENDIAVLKLDSPVPPRKGIKHARLPTKDYSYKPGRKLKIKGWGEDENKVDQDHLKGATVQIQSEKDVPKAVWKDVKKGMFVAGGKTNKADTGWGDSGGGAMHGDTVLGITSWGDPKHRGHGVYTKVADYVDWIKEASNSEGSDINEDSEGSDHNNRSDKKKVLRKMPTVGYVDSNSEDSDNNEDNEGDDNRDDSEFSDNNESRDNSENNEGSDDSDDSNNGDISDDSDYSYD